MWYSLKLFFKEFFGGLYWWISFILFLSDYFIRPYLPETIKKFINLVPPPINLVSLAIIILILLASINAYHKLRMQKLSELYKYLPEANKDRIFKIFYDLCKEGDFLKKAGTERRQKWDEEVLKLIKENCDETFLSIYLMNTNRRFGIFSPLDDKDYDTALTIIKGLLGDNFRLHVKF